MLVLKPASITELCILRTIDNVSHGPFHGIYHREAAENNKLKLTAEKCVDNKDV